VKVDNNLRALVEYRLEQADEALKAAETLLKGDLLGSAVNRAYYAMFYSVLALLALEKKETSKHSGAISLFDKDYVKAGVFPKQFSRWLHKAFDLRQRSDYAVKHLPSREEAEQVINDAVAFVAQVKEVLRDKMRGSDL